MSVDSPKTRAEAEKKRYGCWGGMPKGSRFNPMCCAKEVPDGGRSPLFHQCTRKPGHGPDKLYCKQHAAWMARS